MKPLWHLIGLIPDKMPRNDFNVTGDGATSGRYTQFSYFDRAIGWTRNDLMEIPITGVSHWPWDCSLKFLLLKLFCVLQGGRRWDDFKLPLLGNETKFSANHNYGETSGHPHSPTFFQVFRRVSISNQNRRKSGLFGWSSSTIGKVKNNPPGWKHENLGAVLAVTWVRVRSEVLMTDFIYFIS